MNLLALLISVTVEFTPDTGPGRGRTTEGRGLRTPTDAQLRAAAEGANVRTDQHQEETRRLAATGQTAAARARRRRR